MKLKANWSEIGRDTAATIAGMFLGAVAYSYLYEGESLESGKLVMSAGCGALLGRFFGIIVGERCVSVFWFYLVLIFGIVTLVPWWHHEKPTPGMDPLGMIYVDPPSLDAVLFILVPHLVGSLAGAALCTFVHKNRECGVQTAQTNRADSGTMS